MEDWNWSDFLAESGYRCLKWMVGAVVGVRAEAQVVWKAGDLGSMVVEFG